MIARTTFVSAYVLVCAFTAVAQEVPGIEVRQYPVPEDNAWDYMLRAGYVAHRSDRSAANALHNLQDREPTPDELHRAAEAYEPAFAILREGLYLPCRVPEILLPPLEPIIPPPPLAGMLPPAEAVVMAPQPGPVVGAPAPPRPTPPPLDWVEEALASDENVAAHGREAAAERCQPRGDERPLRGGGVPPA